MYVDFHCHQAGNEPHTLHLRNFFAHELDELPERPENVYYSAGIHPWHTALDADELERQFTMLENAASTGKIAAIGECGLDRLRGAELEIQSVILLRQLAIARKYDLTAVIHCVRAFPELFALIAENALDCSRLLIHSCPGKVEIIRQLMKRKFKLLLSPRFPGSRMDCDTLKALKDYGFGLETDDSALNIKQCYEDSAGIFDCSVPELRKMCYSVFAQLRIR